MTSATSSDTTAHVVTSPTETSADTATVASGEEVSANNATVENTVANTATTNTVTETPVATVDANTATETPAVASGDRASAIDASTTSVAEKAQPTSTNAVSNSEMATSESSSDRKISATLTVPEDRTVTASSAIDDARLLDKTKEQVINLNVSGEGALPEKSRIEIEVTTDIDRGQEKVLSNDLAASSSTKIIDDNNGKVYKSVIDLSGLKAGLQKEMIVAPNSIVGEEVSISPMHRFTTYKLYVGDELVSSQKVTETFVPAQPTIKATSTKKAKNSSTPKKAANRLVR